MADTDSISAPDFGAMLEKDPGDHPEVTTEQQPEEVVTGQPRDEQGRFTKAEQEAAEKAAAEAAGVTTERPAEQKGMVPSARLREEAEARRKAEEALTAREKAFQDELAALRRDMASLRQPAQPAQRPEPPKVPDLIEDPDGYRDYVLSQAQRTYREARINETFEDARDTSPQAFDEAFAAIQQAPKPVKDQIINAANPGKALMRWHGQQKALAKVGTDIDGYEKRVREEERKAAMADPEFRKAIVEAMRAEAGATPTRPDNVTDLPSVNRATGGTGHVADAGASFDEILAAPRRKR